ncbi:MAG TPA: hypothetical protein VLI05_05455 [Candidatus Saccharimonadia bacterium]|nr:hypothetical protein [Candidatus Saccharimonadia bacterium]
MRRGLQRALGGVAGLSLLMAMLSPLSASASGQLASRSLTIGSSGASAVTTYTFSFKPGTSGNIGAIKFELCDSPLEATSCANAGNSSGVSFTSNSASLSGQTGIAGFAAGTGTPPAPTANTFWITNGTPQNVSNSTTVTATFQNVRNPSAANKQFYAKVTTYSDSAGSTEVDFGATAVDTANQIQVSGTMPESLVFCVGTSGTDCTNMTGTTVSLGTFSPASTNVGTSLMAASTNAGFGYVITLTGATLTSGSNTIAAMGTQSLNSAACSPSCTSTTGASQFGSNVRANNVASAGGAFGADVSGSGAGVGSGGYNTANSFRFFSGDTVASASGPTNANLYTNSYLVNVAGSQAAGLYTATMTYICTATF